MWQNGLRCICFFLSTEMMGAQESKFPEAPKAASEERVVDSHGNEVYFVEARGAAYGPTIPYFALKEAMKDSGAGPFLGYVPETHVG
jgi:hypothetical protein